MPLTEVLATASQSYSDYSPDPKESAFGGEADLWGQPITVATLLSPTFAVLFDADLGAGVLAVEDLELEIIYSVPVTGGEVNPALVNSALTSCAIGSGPSGQTRIVVVGKAGMIRVSDDNGFTWQDKTSPTASTLYQVRYGNGEFVAVGKDGAMVVSSNGGQSWSVVDVETSAHLYAVAFDNSRKKFHIGGAGKVRRQRV